MLETLSAKLPETFLLPESLQRSLWSSPGLDGGLADFLTDFRMVSVGLVELSWSVVKVFQVSQEFHVARTQGSAVQTTVRCWSS